MTEELFYPEGVPRTRDLSIEDLRWYAKTGFPTPEQAFDKFRPMLDAQYPEWKSHVYNN